MTECWLKTNRRVLLLGGFIPIIMVLAGGALLIVPWQPGSLMRFVGWGVGLATLIIGAMVIWRLAKEAGTPRVGYRVGTLLFHVRRGAPIEVPIEVVECFFLGQGPSQVPTSAKQTAETSKLVVRLAERATDWHRVEVVSSLAEWCDGYITLNGDWCEPIDAGFVEGLNKRLVAAKRAWKAQLPSQPLEPSVESSLESSDSPS